MQLDKNYDRNASEGTAGDIKYKEHYDMYEGELNGDPLDVEVLLAQLSVVSRETKKGGEYKRETLSVVFKLKEHYWLRLNFKGAYIKDDGTPDRNPVQLHDFLCLAERQHYDCLGNPHKYTFDDGHEVTSFPNLVGLKFKAVVATVDQYRGYDVNEFKMFDINGNSAVELELGNAGSFIEIKLAIEDLKKKHQEYMANEQVVQSSYNTMDTQKAESTASAPAPVNPDTSSEFSGGDDIPF